MENVKITGKPKLSLMQRVRKFNADAGTELDRKALGAYEGNNEILMLREELGELWAAFDENNRQEICDALADIVYVAYGTAAKLGIDLDKALERVCDSNDTKYIDGKLVKNENGKIIKGENYQPPVLDGCY